MSDESRESFVPLSELDEKKCHYTHLDSSLSTIVLSANKDEVVNRLVGIINAEFHTTIWMLAFLSKFNLINLELFHSNNYEIYGKFLEKNKFSNIEFGILIDSTSYCEMLVDKLEID